MAFTVLMKEVVIYLFNSASAVVPSASGSLEILRSFGFDRLATAPLALALHPSTSHTLLYLPDEQRRKLLMILRDRSPV